MLGGGDEDAALHKAGGVTDASDVAAIGFEFESVEIDATEDDAGAGRGGQEAKMNGSAAVKSDAAAFDRGSNCLFVLQETTMVERRKGQLTG
jgi:hypothetical protein